VLIVGGKRVDILGRRIGVRSAMIINDKRMNDREKGKDSWLWKGGWEVSSVAVEEKNGRYKERRISKDNGNMSGKIESRSDAWVERGGGGREWLGGR